VIFDNVTSFHAPLDVMSDQRFKVMVLGEQQPNW
jgi:hypothetical protein